MCGRAALWRGRAACGRKGIVIPRLSVFFKRIAGPWPGRLSLKKRAHRRAPGGAAGRIPRPFLLFRSKKQLISMAAFLAAVAATETDGRKNSLRLVFVAFPPPLPALPQKGGPCPCRRHCRGGQRPASRGPRACDPPGPRPPPCAAGVRPQTQEVPCPK